MKGTACDAGPGRVCPVPPCTQTRGLLISPSKQRPLLRVHTHCASPSQGVMFQCQQMSQVLCSSPGECLAPLFAPHHDASFVVVHWRAVSDRNNPCPCCPGLGVCSLDIPQVPRADTNSLVRRTPTLTPLGWTLCSGCSALPGAAFFGEISPSYK